MPPDSIRFAAPLYHLCRGDAIGSPLRRRRGSGIARRWAGPGEAEMEGRSGGCGLMGSGEILHLCQPDPGKSCGACCGLYNHADSSRGPLVERLRARTRRFRGAGRSPEDLRAFSPRGHRRRDSHELSPARAPMRRGNRATAPLLLPHGPPKKPFIPSTRRKKPGRN